MAAWLPCVTQCELPSGDPISKSKKRNLRRGRTAVRKAMEHTQQMLQACPFLPQNADSSSALAHQSTITIESMLQSIADRLSSIESKLEPKHPSCFNPEAAVYLPVASRGIPSTVLQSECKAARALQQWWRSLRVQIKVRANRNRDRRLLHISDTRREGAAPFHEEGLELKHWRPSSQVLFLQDSPLGRELRDNAAAIIQGAFRSRSRLEVTVGHVLAFRLEGAALMAGAVCAISLDYEDVPELCCIEFTKPLRRSNDLMGFQWFVLNRRQQTLTLQDESASFRIVGKASEDARLCFRILDHDRYVRYHQLVKDIMINDYCPDDPTALNEALDRQLRGSLRRRVSCELHLFAIAQMHRDGSFQSDSWSEILGAFCQVLSLYFHGIRL